MESSGAFIEKHQKRVIRIKGKIQKKTTGTFYEDLTDFLIKNILNPFATHSLWFKTIF